MKVRLYVPKIQLPFLLAKTSGISTYHSITPKRHLQVTPILISSITAVTFVFYFPSEASHNELIHNPNPEPRALNVPKTKTHLKIHQRKQDQDTPASQNTSDIPSFIHPGHARCGMLMQCRRRRRPCKAWVYGIQAKEKGLVLCGSSMYIASRVRGQQVPGTGQKRGSAMLSGVHMASNSPVLACVLMRLGSVSREHVPARESLFGSIRVSAFNLTRSSQTSDMLRLSAFQTKVCFPCDLLQDTFWLRVNTCTCTNNIAALTTAAKTIIGNQTPNSP